jgi:hypothetical protein
MQYTQKLQLDNYNKMELLIRNYLQQKEEAPSKIGLGLE